MDCIRIAAAGDGGESGGVQRLTKSVRADLNNGRLG